MTKQEALDLIRETWETYGAIQHSGLTTHSLRQVEDLLDDLNNLFSDNV